MSGARRGGPTGPLSILQVHERFDGSAKDRRIISLMNHWGGKARHDLLLADSSKDAARAGIDPAVPVRFLEGPAFGLWGGPGRYVALAQAMRGYDLVLSFGWGAMDAVLTGRLFGLLMNLPPIIHHEDGSDLEAMGPLGLASDFYRRVALGAAYALVVPTGRLAHIAISRWGEAASRVRQIPDGIDVEAYAGKRLHSEIPGLDGETRLILGAHVADASPHMVGRLLHAVAPLKDRVRLVLLGTSPAHRAPLDRAAELGLGDVLTPARLGRPRDYLGAFDMVAILGEREPDPLLVSQAMAAGLPLIASDLGEVLAMVAAPNRPFLVPPGRDEALGEALAKLADDPALRAKLGEANHRRALQCFDEQVIFDLYARLYGSAVGRAEALL